MPVVAGVDGCRAGWIVVIAEAQTTPFRTPQVYLCPDFTAVLQLGPAPEVIAVDIPIGLLTERQPGGRRCDRQARHVLGRRASSVFSPPVRSILHARHYDQVRTRGLSRQAFGILPKIREVDTVMTPALQARVFEAHPECAFRLLSGAPMQHNKKTPLGRLERLRALAQASPPCFRNVRRAFTHALAAFPRSQVAADDLLDAFALVRTAARIAAGQACCLPPCPPYDARGLRMEIWY
jgi:predicted RNase H-like nuclease